MTLDPTILARIQFGFTVSFHIIFPTISIGLAMFLAIIEGLWLRTKDPLYLQIYRFWLGIFAMAFGVGVVTGIVLSFEFGLGFAHFGQMAGPAIGPMIALEVLTSFFLEAGFLGIMLFGLHRVGPKLHFLATCMVALGTLMSASWILSANSWMQTPDGITIENGHVIVTDWLKVVVNPTWLYRLPHMLAAAYITGSFLVAGVGAWYLLRGEHVAFGRRTVSLGTAFATILIAVQVFLGDILYGKMLEVQPSKMQAAEGFWEEQSQSPAPYYWFIVPDQQNQRNVFTLGTPYLGSIWLTHSLYGRVAGLKNTPVDRQPQMGWVFYGFRVMYGIAIIMFSLAVASLWLRWRGRLFTARWFLRALVIMTPSGVVATLGGWYLAETGRQPWVIYGLLRTVDAVSPVPANVLLSTLIAFICVYALFMTAFLIFTFRMIRRGPQAAPAQAEASGSLKHALKPAVMNSPVTRSSSPAE
ncbi:cytochrome ubiquinol oxidase subunit I [Methylovirgula sp. 4M-Z18]|uniref:cytochrome ubiquinol oxidase subunit I n=1 Tax=Methylovirgula sp. 4M-Z18 TaxID=2293567 RepID=UPI000E2F323F|nr:cytochrome ubiquinol oxidase subunit I [Methylovirgula sp. 4M-Z18]RFB81121.1 cytochrome ubiquinol oxidase subunit I [Methylovirgula sp. 4M-Z18]